MLSKRIIPVVVLAAIQSFAAVGVHADNCQKVRAAFDVGSSGTKMKVWQIDVCKSRIIKQLFPSNDAEKKQATANIPFKKDLDQNTLDAKQRAEDRGTKFDEDAYPRFSEDILIQAPREFKRLKELAADLKPSDYIAVATEAFRQSQNADQLITNLEKLGITVVIPAQKQEAMIEWMGVTADLRDSTDHSPEEIVSWGIGAGSMQIGGKSKKHGFVQLSSKMASDSFHFKAVTAIKGDPSTPLIPVSKQELDQMVGIAKKEALKQGDEIEEKLSDSPLVVAVGGTINKSVKASLIAAGLIDAKSKTFTSDQVKQLVYGSDDGSWPGYAGQRKTSKVYEGIPAEFVDNTPSNAALVYGVMSALGITKAKFSDVDNTYGAPFTKEFGIHPKAHAVTLSQAKKLAAEKGITVAEAQADLTSENTSVGNSSENMSICNGTPGHVLNGSNCNISSPCMGLVSPEFCNGSKWPLTNNTCIHSGGKGGINLIYTACH